MDESKAPRHRIYCRVVGRLVRDEVDVQIVGAPGGVVHNGPVIQVPASLLPTAKLLPSSLIWLDRQPSGDWLNVEPRE